MLSAGEIGWVIAPAAADVTASRLGPPLFCLRDFVPATLSPLIVSAACSAVCLRCLSPLAALLSPYVVGAYWLVQTNRIQQSVFLIVCLQQLYCLGLIHCLLIIVSFVLFWAFNILYSLI